MTPREQRGLQIAATSQIGQKGKVWLVPSQTGNGGRYTVSPDDAHPHCSCPDHEETGCECKHIFAVRYVIQRELFEDGSVIEQESLTLTTVRKTYPQQWTAYNAAQTSEKETLQGLLHELCKAIPESTEAKMGRPRLPILRPCSRAPVGAGVGLSVQSHQSHRFVSGSWPLRGLLGTARGQF